MSDDSTVDTKSRWPGVNTAYDFVVPSYGWMLSRMEAADSRLQAIQAIATSFTFAIPAAAKALNPSLSFTAGRFVIGIILFVVLMVIGTLTISSSGITLANPNILFDRWLHYPECEFKKNAVAWAGDHFESNATLIRRKGRRGIWMTALFLAELLFLFAWIVTS